MQSVWPIPTASPSSTNGGAPGDGRAVEGADHRRLDPDHAGVDRRRGRRGRGGRLLLDRRRGRRGDRHSARSRPSGARSRAGPRPRSSPRRRRTPGRSGRSRGSARRAARPRRRPRASRCVRGRGSSRSSGSASSPKSASRRSSSSLAAMPAYRSRSSSRSGVSSVGGCPSEVSSTARRTCAEISPGRLAVAAGEQVAQLVDDGLVALGGEHVQEGLGGEHLADRRGQRRPAGLRADPGELLDHLVEPVARGLRAQVDVERRDQARRQAVLRCAGRDPRGERRHRLVADVLVDEVGGPPERGDVDAGARGRGRRAHPRATRPRRGGGRARPGTPRRRSGPRRRARPRSPAASAEPPGALAVEPDRQAARLAHSPRRARARGAARASPTGRGSGRARRRARADGGPA